MSYIGNNLQVAYPSYLIIDDVSSGFNGVLKTFALRVAGSTPVPFPINPQQCLISVNNVVQKPDSTGVSGFTLTGSNIVFATAPTAGWSFFGTILAGADYVNVGANFPSGTAAIPSVTFDQSTGTGLFLASSNVLGITTSGVQRLVVNSSGFVGIGTSSPSSALHVVGLTTLNGTQSFIANSATGSFATFQHNGTVVGDIGTANQVINSGSNTDFAISSRPATSLVFGINTSEKARIDSSGRVGIGTSSPGYLVTAATSADGVDGVSVESPSVNGVIRLRADGTNGNAIRVGGVGAQGNTLRFLVGGDTERARIDSSGRLLVGTSSTSASTNFLVTNGDAGKGVINIASTSATPADGQDLGYISFNDSAHIYNNAIIRAQRDGGTWTATTSKPTRLVFSTTADGASSPTERLRIDSSGRVGIGTSTPGKTLTVSMAPDTTSTTNGIDVFANNPGLTAAQINSTTVGMGATGLLNNFSGDCHIRSFWGFSIDKGAGNLSSGASNSVNADPRTFAIRQYAGGTTWNTQFCVNGSGNVGIGTTNPGDLLTLNSTVGYPLATFNDSGVFRGQIGYTFDYGYFHVTSASTLGFRANGSERARIDSSGRLLVGTSSARSTFYNTASAFIQLEGGATSGAESLSITRNVNDIYGGSLILAKTRGAGDTIVTSGDTIGNVTWQGNDGSKFVQAARIEAQVDGTPGADDMPGRLVFFTTADGQSTPTERMRIGNAGGFKVSNNGTYNLGTDTHEINHNVVGSAAFHLYHSAASTPYGYYFKFTGANPNDATSYVFASFDNVNANIYTIYSNGTVSARSDAKFKKNIETTRNGYLEDLAQLRVVKYNWYNHDNDTPKELGFIAQEVEQVFPGLVSTVPDKDNQGNKTGEVSKSIKTSVFTPMLVKALQEALKRIETLEARLTAAGIE
jgi:hypothetical protein